MSDEKEKLKKMRQETDQRKIATQGAPGDAKSSGKKKQKVDRTVPDPALDDDLEDRLWIGLGILKALARRIHVGVLNSSFLATEPGCTNYCEDLNMVNTSLLVSVPRKLEPYPGRHGDTKGWMGRKAVRFYQEQRGTVPAEGAAPAAVADQPAVEGAVAAATANLDGEDGDVPMPSPLGSPVGAGGPATRSRVPEIGGKVRGFLPAVVLMPCFTSPMPGAGQPLAAIMMTDMRDRALAACRWPLTSPVTSML